MGLDEDLEGVKRQRSTAKGKFTRKLNVLKEILQKNDTPNEVVDSLFSEVSDAYKEVENIHDSYVSLLCTIETDQVDIDSVDAYILDLERKRTEVHILIVKKKDKDHICAITPKCKVKIKALEPPSFNGCVRDYPNFKSDYERLMKDAFGKDPFALRQCLSGEALNTVKGVENDYDLMIGRLDDKYGNCRKIVDEVICDLKSLKPVPEGDAKCFVSMVNKVERCWLDLKKMDLSSEMCSVNVVSHIERILPPTQKREWVISAQAYDRELLFPKLIEYLLKEKSVLEYMNSDVRLVGNPKIAVSHMVSSKEGEESKSNQASVACEIIKTLDTNQSKIEQCLSNLTSLVSSMALSNQNPPIRQGNRMKSCFIHETSNHDIGECKVFKDLGIKDKIDAVRRKGMCFSCLRGGHLSKNCNVRRKCELFRNNNQKCEQYHHPSLHQDYNDDVRLNTISMGSQRIVSRERILLMVSKVYSKGIPISTLWDPGSDITMITYEMASKLGLRGKDVNLSITKVGNMTEKHSSKEYTIPLTDNNGNLWYIKAYGIPEITSNVLEVDLKDVATMFEGVTLELLDRPSGRIDLLVGTDCCALLPQVVRTKGNLQLLTNQFGFCIRGSHPSLGNDNKSGQVNVTVNHLALMNPVTDITIDDKLSLKDKIDFFFSTESLGTSCHPKCGNCRCGNCAIGNGNYSIKEGRELALIESGLKYDPDFKQWTANYPWIRDPNILKNNVRVAISQMKSTEKRLLKMGSDYSRAYHDQMMDMVDRNVARKLTQWDLENYKGPTHYIHHHGVIKPESSTTPLRIVFNSSAVYMGHSLNDYWAKGPDMLNSLFGVLLRFRRQEVAIAGDISKMYNTIRLGKLEQHCHRFVWRDMDFQRPPDHYILTAVSFGDRPSGIISILALRKTAEMVKDKYPDVAKMVIDSSYVDDILYSVGTLEEALRLIRDTENVLSLGGFRLKPWVVSGEGFINDACIEILDTEREKVLGMNWHPREDWFRFQVKLKFRVISGNSEILTRRMILSQVSSIYDPLGLVIPFTLKAKILMRELITNGQGEGDQKGKIAWDKPLSDEIKVKWQEFFKEMLDLEVVTFDRCLRPKTAIGCPMLVIFSDGSKNAYGTCAYLRWQLQSGVFEGRLISAKNRIAPTRQLTIPRLELCGAVLASRLRNTIEKEIDIELGSIIHIVDSSIVRAQIQKESYGFGTFVATRVAEIQSKTDPEEWWWVASEDNPADFTSRPTKPWDLLSDSVWQRGPPYLSLPMERWPISKTCDVDLPDRMGVVMSLNVAQNRNQGISEIISIDRFSSYNKLLRVTGRIISVLHSKSFSKALEDPSAHLLKSAELMWIKTVQTFLPSDWCKVYQRLGPYKDQAGIIVVGQRMAKWLKDNWNQEGFILLPIDHPYTKMYVTHLHRIDHGGIEKTLAKLQAKFWVPGARRLIKSVKQKCVTCRKFEEKTETQSMGQLAVERMKPSPPFYHIAIDLFGPFYIRDTVRRRVKGKAFGVLFNCLASRAVYIDLSDSYDTKSFLATFKRFVSIRGYPSTVYSDGGSQLVAANKELREVVKNWNLEEVFNLGTKEGMTWSFTKSSDAPWQNGCSEALIKSIKRSIGMVIGDSILTFGELQTVLFEIADLLNSRPIGIKPGSDVNLGHYLCPNDLLLGRSGKYIPSGSVDVNANNKRRLDFLNKIVDGFWRKWHRDYFPTLLVRQKWHVVKRNVMVGDIVLVQDSNTIKGKWKLARVIEAMPGRDGVVRDVVLNYKIQKSATGNEYEGRAFTTVNRSVHKLVVLLPIEEQ